MAKLTPAQIALLRRADSETVYVYRDPARLGSGVNKATYTALRAAKLLTMGGYEALKGYPLMVTENGKTLLAGLPAVSEED